MKTLTTIALLLCSIAVVSCSENPSAPQQSVSKYGDYTIKLIDGCEYIEYDDGFQRTRVYSLAHKGNCKNHSASDRDTIYLGDHITFKDTYKYIKYGYIVLPLDSVYKK